VFLTPDQVLGMCHTGGGPVTVDQLRQAHDIVELVMALPGGPHGSREAFYARRAEELHGLLDGLDLRQLAKVAEVRSGQIRAELDQLTSRERNADEQRLHDRLTRQLGEFSSLRTYASAIAELFAPR
jgi:hypothetical protein